MKRSEEIAANIDDYIAGHPPKIRARLSAMRATIRRHAPEAEERISYRIPTFKARGARPAASTLRELAALQRDTEMHVR